MMIDSYPILFTLYLLWLFHKKKKNANDANIFINIENGGIVDTEYGLKSLVFSTILT